MKILSFDVGIRNLAYCVLEDDKIQRWEVCDFGGTEKDFNETSKSLVSLLHDCFPDPEYDAILIENQPVIKNPVMKSIQMIVYSYFCIQAYQHGSNCVLKLCSASNKLKVSKASSIKFEEKGGSKYSENKKRAVLYAKSYLELQDNTWTETFEKHKKKDDLADCFLQGMWWLCR